MLEFNFEEVQDKMKEIISFPIKYIQFIFCARICVLVAYNLKLWQYLQFLIGRLHINPLGKPACGVCKPQSYWTSIFLRGLN